MRERRAPIRIYVGVTDFDQFEFLSRRSDLEEGNFRQRKAVAGIAGAGGCRHPACLSAPIRSHKPTSR